MYWRNLVLVSFLPVHTACFSTQFPFFPSYFNLFKEQEPAQPYVSKIINDELSAYVERMTEMCEVKGTTIAVVRPDGEVEFGAWGIRTEDGDKMTPEVSSAFPRDRKNNNSLIQRRL